MLGQTLAHYKILEPIGAGGMGEVYRARDTKLERDVAVKVLPEEFASDAERLARFEREAKLLASLNHPNIASIHGFEESDGVNALVMELVEGPTLAERIEQGPIPVDEAIAIAKQIAAALEAGHEAGVIHRDLKPANIKLKEDGTVKVLDYGLAKALEGETQTGANSELSQSPTLTRQGTQVGVILGTAAYMSPEQARGKPVDRRTDIWGFGAVLFEMLTGSPLYQGEDVSLTLAAVLTGAPDWSGLPPATPPSIRRLLRRCLEKDPRERLQHVGDARVELRDAVDERGPEAAPSPADGVASSSARLPWTVAALLAVVATALALRSQAPVAPARTARFLVESGSGFVTNMAVSPDGRFLVFREDATRGPLYLRSLDSRETTALPDTEGGRRPFWSPDSRFVGFFVGLAGSENLMRIDPSGGPPQYVSTLEGLPGSYLAGGAWNRDDVILIGRGYGPLFRVDASGGTPTPLLDDPSSNYRWPQFLPGGRRFLYLNLGIRRSSANAGVEIGSLAAGEDAGIYVGSLDSTETTRILPTQYQVRYTEPGYLLRVRDGALVAQAFDVGTMALTDEPILLVDRVFTQTSINNRGVEFSVSAGTLAYRRGDSLKRLRWFDRAGRPLEFVGDVGDYRAHELSPDGTQVALEIRDDGGLGDIWVLDLGRETSRRLTATPDVWEYTPHWSPDGRGVAYSSCCGPNGHTIHRRPADGSGSVEVLVDATPGTRHLLGWFDEGRQLLEHAADEAETPGIITVSVADGSESQLANTVWTGSGARVSPDGRWLAYASGESGVAEVYVKSLVGGATVRVSTEGGSHPRWAPDGSELYYEGGSGSLMSAAVDREDIGLPQPLFDIPAGAFSRSTLDSVRPAYTTHDGERFLFRVEHYDTSASTTWVVNWVEELERMVPTQ